MSSEQGIPDEPPHGNPWTTRSSRVVYENPWIRVREDDVLRPDGKPGIYGVVHFKNLAVGALPIEEDGSVWLVGQHRYPLDVYSWEMPEGGCAEGEDPADATRRELKEETGLEAAHLELLGTYHLSNSVSDEVAFIYRATGLTRGVSAPEGDERIELRRVPWDEAWALFQAGRITDSMTAFALMHEALRRQGGGVD
jgi:8-oxo-dGTP pyrophosphatase MutT (NUDIX family)